jgi:hypothetical protein
MEELYELECEEHGGYFATPDNTNCPIAGCNHELIQDDKTKEFIRKARLKHGDDKFNYALVKYDKNRIDVIIICPEHGLREQTPAAHLRSNYGCTKCGQKGRGLMYRKTTEQFIIDANKVHGDDAYDYSKVKYTTTDTDVAIICKKHNKKFDQTPHSHLNGSGCPDCASESRKEAGRKRRGDTESFIVKARAIHGEFYDYSLTEYILCNIPVKIICPIHGQFEQRPNNHVDQQHGCPKCGIESIQNTPRVKKEYEKDDPILVEKAQNFITNAIEKFGENRFDYSELLWNGPTGLMKIKCIKHNTIFNCSPGSHFTDFTGNCPSCRGEEFIRKSKEKFGNDRFDYSKVKYVNKKTPVTLGCSKHGFVQQKPGTHLRSICGCPNCGFEMANAEYKGGGSQIQTTEWFIERAKERWGEIYGYNITKYKGYYEMIKIICPTHGEVEMLARAHLTNIFGCSECFKEQAMPFSKQANKWLEIISKYKNIEIQYAGNGGEYRMYLNEFNLDDEYEYSKYISVDGIHNDSLTLLEYHGCLWHGCPMCYDGEELNPFNKHKMSFLYEKTQKREEILRKTGHSQLIVIWEHEFKNILKKGENPESNSMLKKYLDTLQF